MAQKVAPRRPVGAAALPGQIRTTNTQNYVQELALFDCCMVLSPVILAKYSELAFLDFPGYS